MTAPIIKFAWGGCGNLINHIIQSPVHYEKIILYYNTINTQRTWASQEWDIRGDLGQNLNHTAIDYDIGLAWEDWLDTSFHYIIKNIDLNHLEGERLYRVGGVIRQNYLRETAIKSRAEYWPLTTLLQDFDKLLEHCQRINADIQRAQAAAIFKAWQEQTRKFYELNCNQVLGYFNQLGLDYKPTTVYNILYENTNFR